MEGLSPLAAWESFYVIVGSSAAALTGLQFVVVALGADHHVMRDADVLAFASPTVVHFCAVLMISAVLSVPWHAIESARLVLLTLGMAGIVYGLIVVRRMKSQARYRAVMEDWVWFATLPIIAYVTLLVSAWMLAGYPDQALLAIGGVSLLLLFIGIHNAWDAATHIAMGKVKEEP